MDEIRTLRQELINTQQKLQGYADTIVSLHGELRNLKANICKKCKQKFMVPPNLGLANASQRHNVILPVSISSTDSNSTKPSVSSLELEPIITNENLESTSTPLAMAPISGAATSDAPEFFARHDSRETAVHVTFVDVFTFQERVRSLCFSADGKYLAVGVGDEKFKQGSLFIYKVETRKVLCKLNEYSTQYSPNRNPMITSICFSPNGRYLVVGEIGYRTIVWDIPNRRIRSIFKNLTRRVVYVDFSPNGRLVTYNSDTAVLIANIRSGFTKVFSSDSGQKIVSVRFSPDGRHVLAGSDDGVLQIWNVRTGQVVRRWNGHEGRLWSVRFTPDGEGVLSVGQDRMVKVWDVGALDVPAESSIMPIREYTNGHTASVYSGSVSPDGRLIATTSSDKTGIVWDTKSGEPHSTLVGHRSAIVAVDFSPNGIYLGMGGRDRLVTLWRYNYM